ncbi:ABC transporter ATP-binding protein [uncultured Nonlabens sp.]|uniref:ABC transporter ATP-binding protein n=1 Tax=uncultured Nonlabens sp. TaxID=859306 RepID=UPI0030D6EB16|tara:strand:+ start:38291 stop:39493 length:1203 start_codon:yes stop_codon:yes gene_type:complete
MEENQEVLVKVEGLSKKFCKGLKKSLKYGMYDLVANLRGKEPSDDLRPDEFWALKDINFELRRGECLGLIGHNGAGKSTLLKILNGLINPDHGKVTMRGRVGALIELGAGFNGVMTGRENIYNNGAVLGFTREEIDVKVEEIIDFAEIREFIDMPVRNYSSGMKVRLGFSVAAQMEPDVLIIDEVLAVGDVGFRIKCFNRINNLLKHTAVIFVSHSMPQVAKISSVALLLKNGYSTGITTEIGKSIEEYYSEFKGEDFQISSSGLKLCSMNINNTKLNLLSTNKLDVEYLQDLIFKFNFETNEVINRLGIVIRIFDKSLISVATIQNSIDGFAKSVSLSVPNVQLGAGTFSLEFYFINYTEADSEIVLYHAKNFAELNVKNAVIINHSPFQLKSSIIKLK